MNTIDVTQDDQICRVNLNRPDQLNAINAEMLSELIAVFEDIDNSREIRVVILSGMGRGFCAGADLMSTDAAGSIPGTDDMRQLGYVYKYQEYLTKAILAIHECDKPVITAVNGAAVGGGLAFALASDFRIASTQAKFGSVFIKVGLSSCDVGTSYFLPRLIPPTKALELMATGRIFTAQEANELGLLNDLVEPEALDGAAVSLAEALMENSEYGVWMTKKGFWSNLNAPSLRHAMELENRTQVLGYFTGGMEDAMEAFARGEKPKWRKL